MNVKRVNFQDILAFYFEGTGASAAATEILIAIANKNDDWLVRMLRNHEDEGIYDKKEIRFRRHMDSLIGCLSVLEVAITGRLIPVPDLVDPFWSQALVILDNVHVRRYYLTFYPERLPFYLHRRLTTGILKVEEDVAPLLTMSFIELDKQFVSNLQDGYVLRFLDDFSIGGYRLDDFLQVLDQPENFISSLLTDSDERSILDQAVYEFSAFCDFCFKLDEVLTKTERWTLLRSEIWLRYAYWFGIIGEELEQRFGKALEKFVAWKAPSGAGEGIAETQAYVDRASATLKRLVSADYASFADEVFGVAGTSFRKK